MRTRMKTMTTSLSQSLSQLADRGCCLRGSLEQCEFQGLSVSLSVCPFVCLFVHLSVCLCLSVCPLVCVLFPDLHSPQLQIYLGGADY